MQCIFHQHIEGFENDALDFLNQHPALHNKVLGKFYQLKKVDSFRINSENQLITLRESGKIQVAAILHNSSLLLAGHADAALLEYLAQLATRRKLIISQVFGPSVIAKRLAQAWASQQKLGDYELFMQTEAMELTQITPFNKSIKGQLRMAVPSDTKHIEKWIQAFYKEALGQDNYKNPLQLAEQWINDKAVHLLEIEAKVYGMAVEIRRMPNCIAISHVYVPPADRKQGFGFSLMQLLSEQLLRQVNCLCLFVDINNPFSNSIYQTIGYQPIGKFSGYKLLHNPST